MFYMNKLLTTIAFIGAVLGLNSNAYSQANPFSVMMKNTVKNVEGEENHLINVTVRSISKHSSKYFLKVDVPSVNFQVMEGKTTFSGEINGLGENTFDIFVSLVTPGEGEIKAGVYAYSDDQSTLETNTKRLLDRKSVV